MKLDIKKFIPKIQFKQIKFTKINLKLPKKQLITIAIILAVIILAVVGRKSPFGQDWNKVLPDSSIFDENSPKSADDNKYTAFFFEVYDLILQKYWNQLSDEQLINLTKLAMEKITEQPVLGTIATRQDLRENIIKTMENKNEVEKKDFIAKITDLVLANLEPFGRSRLYTSKKQQELSNTVKNVNPDINHYDILGVDKNASKEQVSLAYNQKLNELKNKGQTPETKQDLANVEKAYEVLTDEGNKKVYDDVGANPTMPSRLISPRIYYVHITKFSPTTVEELKRVMDKVDQGDQLDTLILDLRGNIGGAIDGLPYFLGPFIGNNQHAYQFFARGNKEDFITKTGWIPSLVRYKKVVILTDKQVQSSAEVFAAVLKKYNVGIIVGTATKGWGTVESVFKINNQPDSENETYSVLLVHSLTLREDGVPIEGKGVDPTVSTDLPNWEGEFNRYFNFPELTGAVRQLLSAPPTI
ncbi:hypothetical protein A2V49_01420 [candidate division WWE3 bacterium RBG_19FT_COMBO_34_6]|uniref:J domain-containing protein n=1 Tax=candidate division WWE3 bacterium RBG_19FT_COMBO_34_6 TaxID=1802612 RepID=A0A1F4UK51_UNCKA|nr:MAG: hypothetical protein A2V49_01420 [candidate division WWE3 bacterium RBG_19FT_COMBO_34_6]